MSLGSFVILLVTLLWIARLPIPWIVTSRFSLFFCFNFSYVFNVCGVVNTVPISKAGEGSVCYAQGSDDPVHYPAYQVSQSADQCMRLGTDATKDNTRWSLIGWYVYNL